MTTDQPTSLEEAREALTSRLDTMLWDTKHGDGAYLSDADEDIANLIAAARAEVIREVEAVLERVMAYDNEHRCTGYVCSICTMPDGPMTFLVARLRALSQGGEER